MLRNEKPQCQFGNTSDPNGYCDGSHLNKILKMKNKILTIITLLITSTIIGQELNLDTSSSKLKWTGKEITAKQHYGSIDFKSGILTLEKGKPVSGKFIVDMKTLKNEDLPEDYRGRLEAHLKSDDFFSVDKFSEAILEITNPAAGPEKFKMEGFLTIKEITHAVTFTITNTNNNWKANLSFDRSKYDVRFRSGTFFENLGDKLILDEIVIETDLIFN